MSWHYLQGEEVDSWHPTSSVGAPDALLKLIPSLATSSSLDNEMGSSQNSPSGMTSAPLRAPPGGTMSTSSQRVGRAKTSPLQAKAKASPAPKAGSGGKSIDWFAKWNQATSSWRTAQLSLIEEWETYSAPWPRSGFMRGGVCWELTTSAPIISGTGCGSSLPTPTASRYGSQKSPSPGAKRRLSLEQMAKKDQWPTPTVSGLWNRPGASATSGWGLVSAVMERESPPPLRNAAPQLSLSSTQSLAPGPKSTPGLLNPEWVEWLMGWPIGHTASESLDRAKFQSWLASHGQFLEVLLR